MLDNAKIKEILLAESYVEEADMKAAEEYAVSHNASITDYLYSEGILSADIFGQAIAEYFGVKYVNLSKQKIDDDIFNLIPELVAKNKGVIAFGKTDNGTKVAMTDPGDLGTKNLLGKRVGDNIIVYYTTENDLVDALSGYRSSLKDEFENIVRQLSDPKKTREERDEIVVKVVDTLLKYGYQNKSSDIHVEPYASKITVRFRIDGVMHDVLEIDRALADLILTRVKILSKMRTDEHMAAQDGKLRYKIGKEKIDVRVSIVPVTYGETIVMRILSDKARQFTLTDVGMSGEGLKKVKKSIKNPHGMILVTGPTGSGKTTTLYAILKILNRREVNLATIEDPVEYDIEGITQIQVNDKTNLTFAKGLRALVRQDPDVIMVGEIRDEETAGIAVNSALTGHLVLSTLHTNDSATTLPRLLDMGVEPFLVASTINIVIAQRLVRKICSHCRISYNLSDDEVKMTKANKGIESYTSKKGIKNLQKTRVYKGKGCNVCGDTGYSGRIGVFEVLEMEDNIKELILKHASSDEIMKVAKENGMMSMMDDGLDKVFNGETTLEEVLRVAGE
mgnify:CR=1 FL=1